MELDASVVWDFAGELVGTLTQRKGRTLATVTRIDPDGTTWVTTDGDGEAPAVGVAAGVAVGDTVALEWDGATMGIRANVSDPAPTGAVVRHAQRVASAAQKVAEAVNQHFFTDTHGIHVTEATQEDWEQSHMGPNVLINSLGQLFRDGLNNLLTMTTENGARALTIWDGAGNAAANVLAVFGEIVRIGRVGYANVTIDADSIDLNIGNIVAGALQLISDASRAGAQLLFYNGAAKVSGLVTRGGIVEVSIGADSASATIDSTGKLRMVNETGSGDISMYAPANSGAYIEVDSGNGSTAKVYGDHVELSQPTLVNGALAMGAFGGEIGVYDSTNSRTIATMDEFGHARLGGESFARGVVGQTNTVPAGGYIDVPVYLDPDQFDAAPTVIVGLNSTSNAGAIGQCSVAVTSVSATEFTARLFNAGSTDRSPGFCWIAMG